MMTKASILVVPFWLTWLIASVQLAVGDVDFLHAAGAGVQQAEAVASSGVSPTVVRAISSGVISLRPRFQAETRLRLLQGVVRLFQGGLAGGVLEQDVCDVVLHGVVLLLKNASAVHFCSTAPPFPLSFFLGV